MSRADVQRWLGVDAADTIEEALVKYGLYWAMSDAHFAEAFDPID
jgi:hypothetical protein